MNEGVSIGAYTLIEDHVIIGSNTKVGNYNTICTGTTIGADCRIYHNCSIGEEPQDMKYAGEITHTRIGNRVTIRESVTINRGTAAHGTTEIGNDVLLMASAHIAHDCIVKDNVIMANLSTLGGHVKLGEWVSLGGGVLVHQFTEIGEYAFVGGGYRVVQNVPPYILTAGEPLRFAGINKIGLKRRGFSDETRNLIKRTYRMYFRAKTTRSLALKEIKDTLPKTPEVQKIVRFIESSTRGII